MSRWDNGQSNASPTNNAVFSGILKRNTAAKPAIGSKQQMSIIIDIKKKIWKIGL